MVYYTVYSIVISSMFSFSLLWMYVLRDINRSKVLFILIIASLAIASTALLMTVSILNGFRTMLTESERGWLGDIVITPKDTDRSIDQVRSVEEMLKTLPEIEAYSLRSRGDVLVRIGDKKTSPYKTLGINPADDNRATWLKSKIIEGQYFDETKANNNEVILGKLLSDTMIGVIDDNKSVHTGETIFLLSASGEYVPYKVSGIVDAKTFYPNWSAFLSKDQLEKLGASERNSQLIIKLYDDTRSIEIRDKLKAQFPEVTVKTWQEESGYVKDILETVIFITSSIHNLLVVTVFMVISIVIFINVNQKKKQIGILKAMGTNNSFIVTAHIIESFIYSIFGFAVGISIFFVFLWWSINHPTALLIGDFYLQSSHTEEFIAFITLAIAAIGGALIPSFMAARMRIIDVIRNN